MGQRESFSRLLVSKEYSRGNVSSETLKKAHRTKEGENVENETEALKPFKANDELVIALREKIFPVTGRRGINLKTFSHKTGVKNHPQLKRAESVHSILMLCHVCVVMPRESAKASLCRSSFFSSIKQQNWRARLSISDFMMAF